MEARSILSSFLVVASLFSATAAVGSDRAADHYLQGLELARQGRIEEAIVEMETASDLDSTAPEIHRELSRLLLQAHRPAEATEPARKATALAPADPEGHWLLGQSLLEQSKVDEAIAALHQAVELDRTQRTYTISLLTALQLSGKPQEALRLLRPDEGGIEPDSPYLLLRRGELEEEVGRIRDALTDYLQTMRLAPEYPDAPARLIAACRRLGPSDSTAMVCSMALQIDPKQSGVRRTLVQILVNLGREEEAVPHLETLHAEDPLDAPVIMQLGVIRFRGGDPVRAIPLIRAAIRIDPTIPDANDWLWRALDQADSIDAALHVADQIVESVPGGWQGHWYRAVSLARLKEYPEAETELEQVDRISPGNRNVALLSAMILAERGDMHAARSRIKRLLKASPEDHEAIFQLAQIEQRAGNLDEALALYRHLIETDPENASALNDAGYLCAEMGVHLDEALDWTRRAVSLDGSNAAYRDSYGWALYRVGRYAEAIDQLEEAAKGDSQAEIQIHLAQALRAVGRLEYGRQILLEVLASQPAADKARQLLMEWGEARPDSGNPR